MAVKRKVPTKKSNGPSETSRLAVARSKNNVRAESRTSLFSVPVYTLAGRTSGTLSLPKEIFGKKINKRLLAQALRVYMTNQKYLLGSTKTRGEVRGSTAKIYRQKGTGRARHGAITAPIFVGGGITFGPSPRKVRLNFPKKMRKAALLAALSAKMTDNNIFGLSGLEKATGKTKEISELMLVMSRQSSDKKAKKVSALIVTGEKYDNVIRGVRNIKGVDVLPANLINAYEVLRHEMLILTKDAVAKLGEAK